MFRPHVILEGIDSLPTLPEAVNRLSILVKDDKTTAGEFEQAVLLDPVLTANMIRAANAINTAGTEPITTVSQAVERIGMQRLFEVAVGSSLRRTLPARIPGYGITAQKFWIHCIAAATIAETLAKKLELPSADTAFTTGLLHDIGQLVIGNFLAETMPEANWWTFDSPAKERNLLGCNHCDVGSEIALRWKLPEAVIDSCRWHHELPEVPENCNIDMVTVMHASDALAYMIGFPGVGYVGEVLHKLAPARLGISAQELYVIAKSVRHIIGQNAVATGMGSSLNQ
jgi:putative nucleotidyltransferase with HDIG domain